MSNYIIRAGFTIALDKTLYSGGQSVDLTEAEYLANKHKLEGTESSFKTTPKPNTSKTNAAYPAPYLSKIKPAKMLTGTSRRVTVEGSFFTPNMSVEIEQGSIDSVEFESDNRLTIAVTASSVAGGCDLVFDNGSKTTFEDAIEFFDVPELTVDLRSGGTEFSSEAIEMRSNMSFERTADGLIFTGENPWASWVRMVGDNNAWVWSRNQKKTLSWIFQNSNSCGVGIGSFNNNAISSQQYYEAEIISFVNGNSISSLFGNNGTPGNRKIQSFSAEKSAEDTLKAVFTNNGENGGTFKVYRLYSPKFADWFVGDRLLGEITIDGIGSDEQGIMPFIIPRSGTVSKFLGFILEDEDEL